VPPDAGTLTLTNGTATYQPTPNLFGTDSFVYRAISGAYTSAPVTVTLNVLSRDDAPVAGSGNALRLDGQPGGVATTEEFNLGGNSFTLELWARRADTHGPAAGDAQILAHLGPESLGASPGVILGWSSSTQFVFETRLGQEAVTVPATTASLDTNWHHWAAVYDADTGRRELYRDGVSQGSVISTNAGPGPVQLFLGSVYGLSGWFRGEVDEVRLWTKVRTTEEIQAAADVPLVGNEAGLFAYYRLDEGNGLTAHDSSAPKPGGLRFDAAISDPVTWITGITNLSVVTVPRNSPGVAVFLPGFDLEGDALTWQILSPTPANGRLQADPTRPGLYTYIPNRQFYGLDPIRYQVTAAGLTSAVATVTMDVEFIPLPPVIFALRDVEFEEEDPPLVLAVRLADLDDRTGDSLTLSATSSNPALLPVTNLVFGGTGNLRTVTLSPVAGEIGTSTVEITVSNGSKIASTTFEVRVNPRLAYVVVNAGATGGRPAGVAAALNESGQLAGWVAGTGSPTNSQPFFYTGYGQDARSFLVENLGGGTGGALAVNDAGIIAGAVADAQGLPRAFVVDPRQDTQPTDLGLLPGGTISVATAVNAAGLIAGYAQVGDGTYRAFTAGPGAAPLAAVALTNGYTGMWAAAMNEAGEVVGHALTAGGNTNAFLYALGQVQDLGRPAGASHAVATAINDGGAVFGHAVYPAGAAVRAVRWDKGAWTELGDLLGGGRTEVAGANRYGQFVGRALDTNGVWRAYLYTDGRAFDLHALLPAGSAWTLDAAAGLNDRAQIAATGRLGDGPPQALLLFPATEIGRRVYRPEGTLAELPTITILQDSGGSHPDNPFHWSAVDRKLFAIQPVIAEIKWRTGTFVVTTNLTEFGDTFIRQKFTNEVLLTTLSFNIWPADPDLHVVGTPVQVQPDQPGFQHAFVERIYTTADGAAVDGATKVFTSPSTGYSVLQYLKTGGLPANPALQPQEFTVVRSILWNDPLHLTNAVWTIGTPLTNALHNDYPGLNGYLLFTNTPYDATAYDRAFRAGPILPVNTHTEGGDLVVVWYRQNRLGVAWSSLPYEYALAWPTNADTLVIASLQGSGPLPAALYPQPQVYGQPDPAQPGFNPNEEHALLSGGVLYALRSDLNAVVQPKASDPYVLLRHLDPASGEPRFKVFSVVDEQAPWFFRYEGVAGNEIQPPPPVSLLPLMTASNRVVRGPAWQDYHGKFYARAAGFEGGEGDVVMQWFYPLQPGFFYDLDRDGTPELAPGDAVPWLDRRPGGITGDPVNVNYVIAWPAGVPPLRVGQSLTTATGGLPDIADMAAAQVVFDSLDPTGAQPVNAAARLYDPLSPRTVKLDAGFTFPDSVRRAVDPATGLEFFPDLPYVLRVRAFHDPQNRRLGFRGYVYAPSDGGAPVTLVNVMSTREREAIAALDTGGGTAFGAAVTALFHKTRNPNDVDLDGDAKADEALLIGLTMQVVTNRGVVTTNVIRETLLGAKALTAGQPVPPLAAPPAYAVRFDGGDAAMQVGPVFTNVADNFTLEFWVRPEAGRGGTGEAITGGDGLNGQRYAVFPTQGGATYGGGHAGAGVSVGTNGVSVFVHSDYLIASPLVYETNLVGWHHVAVVYQQRQPFLYLDGSLVRVGLASPQVIHPSADVSGTYGPFPGSVTDLRVWDYARTPDEIAYNRDQRLTGAEPGLAGLWRFDENAGTNVADASPAAHAGTLVGGAAWTTDAPPRAPAQHYVVVAENNDPTLGGLPVGLHVLRVDDALARGALALIQPDNVLDERVTLRHTADFAGQPETFVFQWFYQFDAQDFDPRAVPGTDAGGAVTNLGAWVPYPAGTGVNDVTLGTGAESSLLTLSDTWWVMRFGVATAGGQTNWSGWAGDPSGTDAVPRAMLVPGWIKRVLGGINLFAQRSADFQDNQVNTLASTIAEAGPRYEGDVALNPGVLDNFGLIEIYQTVLRRGRSLSIDGTPPVDFAPADEALLLAAGRIADLYLLHANEAFADAADPTIGLTTDSTELGSVASSIFAFENQLDSLLEEELAMLRGRDDRSGGVGAAPVYNRLFWNFTGSDGEVAYVAKYGIPDQNGDGFLNALDAKILFPQGHGDAWGHYLTALTTYYDLLRSPNFTWTPRSQSTLVAGIPIQVNYEDERRFALAAAAKARTGAEIVDRAWRLDYVDDPVAQFRGDFDPDPQRAWSATDWARRAALGAYLDWVAGNAILPPTDPDPTHTGIQRVDRTTVLELTQIVTEAGTVLAALDQADAGLNPDGLARGVVPFDIDPDQLRTGFSRTTHFEQVYGRALQALENAEVTFNRATLLSSELRRQQNSVSDFSVAVADQELDYKNQLIALFGYPHAGNLGAGRAFPAGYDGPDLTFWMYVDTLDVTPENNPRGDGFTGLQGKFTGMAGDWGAQFSGETLDLLNPATNRLIQVEYPVSAADYGFQAPAEWGRRRAEGQLQANLRQLVLAQSQLRQAARTYEAYVTELEEQADLLSLRYGLRRDQINLLNDKSITVDTFNGLLAGLKVVNTVSEGIAHDFDDFFEAVADGVPGVEGLAIDALAGLRAAALLTGQFSEWPASKLAEAAEIAEVVTDFAKELAELEIDREMEVNEQNFEVTERLKELEILVRQEPALRLNLFDANQAILQAARSLEATLAEGQRLLVQRTIFRQVTAGSIQADRYRDLGLRIFRNDALQKYEAQFALAARYVHLAAAAYDYELNLGTDAGAGSAFGAQIVRERSLGELADGGPVVGRVGLASLLGRMRQNFDVLKGQLGLSNDRPEKSRFSLRTEALRILPAGTNETANAAWRAVLQQAAVTNLWDVPEFRRYCRSFAPESAGPQPGLVLRFGTTVTAGQNFFGQPLGPLDSSYDPSEYATRIRSLAVWLSDYDAAGLAAKPRAYLVPAGADRLRAAAADDFTVHDWQVQEQRIPVPYPITAADLAAAQSPPLLPAADGGFTEIRRHSAFRAYQDAAFDLDEFNETSRLVGRSVWNTQWVLIIPGAYLLGDPEEGLERFVNSVSDIKLYFQTYSASGN
jgi:probable HAF family extracellular repeat protein